MPDDPKGNDQNQQPAKPPSLEDLLAQNATLEGRAKTAAMFGVRNEEVVGPEIIDVFDGDPEGKAASEQYIKAVGGPEGFPVARQDVMEIVALAGIDLDAELEHLPPAEQAAAIVAEIGEYREILNDPRKATALLGKIYAHPDQHPLKTYLGGNCPPELSRAFTRLFEAAHRSKKNDEGETP